MAQESPLREFSTVLGKLQGSDSGIAEANALIRDELLKAAEPALCKEFTSIQAEVLLGRPDFNGVKVVKVLEDPNAVGAYDPDSRDISVVHKKKPLKLSNTFAHEMVHGIEFHCDCQTETKLLGMLKARDVTDLKGAGDYGSELMQNLQKVLTLDVSGQFKNQVQEHSGNEHEILSRELGSYCFESVYNEMVLGIDRVGTFTDRFTKILPKSGSRGDSPSKELARDLVAVSMYEVNNQMIRYVNRPHAPALSPERQEVLGRLHVIHDDLTPHYKAAISREVYKDQFQSIAPPNLDKRYRKEIESHELDPRLATDKLRRSLTANQGDSLSYYAVSAGKGKSQEVKR